MHALLCSLFASQDAKEKRGILKELVESFEASALPKRVQWLSTLGGGVCSREGGCFPPHIAPLRPELLGSEEAVVCGHQGGMLLCREGDGVFLIPQHNAAIQGLGKAHESRCELPQPGTAGKHVCICSATLRMPLTQE